MAPIQRPTRNSYAPPTAVTVSAPSPSQFLLPPPPAPPAPPPRPPQLVGPTPAAHLALSHTTATMPHLATSAFELDTVAKLIAKTARRLSVDFYQHDQQQQSEPQLDLDVDSDLELDRVAPRGRDLALSPRRQPTNKTTRTPSVQDHDRTRTRTMKTTTTTTMLPPHVPCPFRRSLSQPENPTSDFGQLAIAEEISHVPHSSPQKLVLLFRFSVSEQDVVICNRVRCGVDPVWFRRRSTGPNERRYQRSLSVEEARLAATRRRLSLRGDTSSPSSSSSSSSAAAAMARSGPMALLPLAVPENEVLDDPVLLASSITTTLTTNSSCGSSTQKLSSPRARSRSAPIVPLAAPQDSDLCGTASAPRFSAGLGPAPLTPREKAMHGRYLIRESFANGSYGSVCAGEDNASHQEVAVKIIPKDILISPEEKQSVIREQLIHKSLDHPHIIKLIDVFEDEGAHYFILERADNGSLSTLITYAGMPEDQSLVVFRQLLQALEYLHRHHIVHHDIKPHNILLHKGGGDIKLCDFGASRAFNAGDASLPFAGVFGTPGYIAPELLLGDQAYGPPIDMFSAGILLFEMVFGYAPFYPPSACTYQPLDFPAKSPASPQVQQLIARLLEKDPAQRITASQALGHPWITGGAPGRSAPNSPVSSPRAASAMPTSAMTPTTAPILRPARTLERCLSK